jgi:hypothetical protein
VTPFETSLRPFSQKLAEFSLMFFFLAYQRFCFETSSSVSQLNVNKMFDKSKYSRLRAMESTRDFRRSMTAAAPSTAEAT